MDGWFDVKVGRGLKGGKRYSHQESTRSNYYFESGILLFFFLLRSTLITYPIHHQYRLLSIFTNREGLALGNMLGCLEGVLRLDNLYIANSWFINTSKWLIIEIVRLWIWFIAFSDSPEMRWIEWINTLSPPVHLLFPPRPLTIHS